VGSSAGEPGTRNAFRPAARHAQRFLSAFSGISPHFRPGRHLLSAADYRQVMADRFAVWNEITGATTMAAA